jgi:molybdopterin molybdotransferase
MIPKGADRVVVQENARMNGDRVRVFTSASDKPHIRRTGMDQLLAALVGAAGDHDLIVTSGGASAGFADHLTQAVSQRGHLEFWRLDMRPGKPIGFGDVDHCPILILPGNPLAAVAGCAILGRTLVYRLAGC